MARKISAQKKITRPRLASVPRAKAKRSLVSSLKSRAMIAARKAIASKALKPILRPAKKSPQRVETVARVEKVATAKPIPRRSVVHKPPRGPSVSTRRPEPARLVKAQPRPPSRFAAPKVIPALVKKPDTAAVTISSSVPPRYSSSSVEPTIKRDVFSWPEGTFSIPGSYGEDRIVLMVKDPWWIFAYWEIQSSTERQALRQLLPHEVEGLSSILRIYDVTGLDYPNQAAHSSFDILLSGLASNWYINTNAPNREFVVEIGLLTRNGRFLMLSRSNRVATPRFGPSEVLDEEWMCPDEDYWKLFGLSVGFGMGGSPSGLQPFLERRMFSPGLFSPGMFSPGLFSPVKVRKERGFWFWVDAELIVFGGTDPKARVTFQGQPVALRPDGTFSVRMALPDGQQIIPVTAVSPDQLETRTITPTVNRKTEYPTPQTVDPDSPSALPQRSAA
ncbi:MAG: DUF4912 domain-containing protein [Candidatus Omnitrophica bacterium]|nr:DUF4912 domain-containing protein [Candidatus Omnitrophota bacterium]